MKNAMLVLLALVLVTMASIVPWADAQQKPSNVLIWCQNTNGTSSPCVAGNALDYDSGGGTVNQGTVGLVFPASGGPVAAPGNGTDGLLVNLGANNDVTVTSGTVTANAGTNLNTSALLTTSAHDAAFGTAGAADAQVRTVQGIASMTPLQVQSNSANLATETTVGTLLTSSTFTGRFPAAFASADNIAAQTATALHGLTYIWDGATWDRWTGAVTQSGNWSIRAQDGTGNALTSATRGSERALSVQIVDGSGTQITSFGGSGGTSSNFGSAFPTPGTAAGFNDGTNMQGALVIDGNTGAGTAYVLGANLLKRASGGPVEAGTASDPLRVDPTGTTTQPVSAASLPLPTGAATAANQDGIIKDGAGDTTQANVSNGNVHQNIARINDAVPLMGAGNTGTGSPRVTIATDQAALNGLGVYVEDSAETAGGNLVMAGSVRRDTAASSAGTTGDNATLNTDAAGLLWTRTIDPCSSTAKTFAAINISTATTTEITPSLAGASTNYYICSLVLVTAAANNIALVDDDTDNCTSVTSGLAGGTTSGSGFNMAANSGMTFGNGMGSVFKTAGTNRVVCLVTSAATQLSGTMSYVAAP